MPQPSLARNQYCYGEPFVIEASKHLGLEPWAITTIPVAPLWVWRAASALIVDKTPAVREASSMVVGQGSSQQLQRTAIAMRWARPAA